MWPLGNASVSAIDADTLSPITIKYIIEGDILTDICIEGSLPRKIQEITIPSAIKADDGRLLAISTIRRTAMTDFVQNQIHIQKLIICEGIKRIDEGAFVNIDVGHITIPCSCQEIPLRCFENAAIGNIVLPDCITSIGRMAFSCCTIQKIRWPSDCHHIESGVFSGCYSLDTIDNIAHVTDIEASAFEHCGLKSFCWPEACPEIPYMCFYGCSNLSEITIKGEITYIGPLVFFSTNIKKIDLSASYYCTCDDDTINLSPFINVIEPYYGITKRIGRC